MVKPSSSSNRRSESQSDIHFWAQCFLFCLFVPCLTFCAIKTDLAEVSTTAKKKASLEPIFEGHAGYKGTGPGPSDWSAAVNFKMTELEQRS